MAMVRSAGVEASVFEPYVMDFLGVLPYFFRTLAKDVDAKQYPGDENNMAMMTAGAVHVAHTARDAKVDTTLPDLIKTMYEKTIALGHGENGLASVIEVLKNSSST